VKDAIVEHGGARLPISVSVGLASAQGSAVDVATMLGAADEALDAVTHSGRNSVRVADAP
jgi:GGDEF domain-containing protein